MSQVTAKDLIKLGVKQGPWIPRSVKAYNDAIVDGCSPEKALQDAMGCMPPPPMEMSIGADFHKNIDAFSEDEEANTKAVFATMKELMKTPVIKEAAVMPDACPAGPLGTIPVGGVVRSSMIHPGMHSADICCSVSLTNLGDVDPKAVLDQTEQVTHFGPGGRPKDKVKLEVPVEILEKFEGNKLLRQLIAAAKDHFGTQGDGNHFAFVGRSENSGDVCLVTHHGSRKPGAMLYKAGMKIAEKHTKQICPDALKQNTWINPDTAEGEMYWEALQIIREWTKANHYAIHNEVCRSLGVAPLDQFWNEHNFVFRKSDGDFYHAKGATPAFDGWADDATEHTLIPLNMAEPILVAKGLDAKNGLGFSPHGAGRNLSRTKMKKKFEGLPDEVIFENETTAKGIDARFYCGKVDISELPCAYKDANAVTEQIDRYGLADIRDRIMPYGSIMAGDWEQDAPWRK